MEIESKLVTFASISFSNQTNKKKRNSKKKLKWIDFICFLFIFHRLFDSHWFWNDLKERKEDEKQNDCLMRRRTSLLSSISFSFNLHFSVITYRHPNNYLIIQYISWSMMLWFFINWISIEKSSCLLNNSCFFWTFHSFLQITFSHCKICYLSVEFT